jgi:fumarate hydratase class II
VRGLEADVERCRQSIETSLAMATALAPKLGYDNAAALAKEAYVTGKSVRQVAQEKGVMPVAELNALLDPAKMIGKG